MSLPDPVQTLVERVLAGHAPLPLREAAARGALPLPRAALTRLFVHLVGDSEEHVRNLAKASLDGMERDTVSEVLADGSCAPEVLRHFASRAVRDAALAERIAFHRAAPDDALAILASGGNSSVIDLVLTNQERLLASPGLLDRLTVNPALRPDQRGKILDFIEGLARQGVAVAPPEDAGPSDIPEDLAPEEAARILEVDVGELYAASEILGGEEFESAPDLEVRSAYKKIIKLGAAQKAMLAMKGGRDERTILVRDTNKVVALSVLKNPRLTDQEVEEFARSRGVAEEVLRALGSNREWAKRYSIASALVHNPRTPPGISLNFVQRLTTEDLKDLARDRNVPELIRRSGKRVFETRTQKSAMKVGRKH